MIDDDFAAIRQSEEAKCGHCRGCGVYVAAVASAEQWLCVLLTAVSGAAGAGGGQTGNCISHPRPETSPGHQISPPVDPARHYATPSPLQLTCQRDFAKFHIA